MARTTQEKIDEIRKEFPLAAQAIEYLQQQMIPDGGLEPSRFRAPKRSLSYLDRAIKKLGSKTLGDLFDQPLDQHIFTHKLPASLSCLTAWKEFVYCSPAWDDFKYEHAGTDYDVAAKAGHVGLAACKYLDQIAYDA